MISKGCKSIFPIQHQEIWDRYKQHVQAFWTPEEVLFAIEPLGNPLCFFIDTRYALYSRE